MPGITSVQTSGRLLPARIITREIKRYHKLELSNLCFWTLTFQGKHQSYNECQNFKLLSHSCNYERTNGICACEGFRMVHFIVDVHSILEEVLQNM